MAMALRFASKSLRRSPLDRKMAATLTAAQPPQRAYTALSHAPFRQPPTPAAFATSAAAATSPTTSANVSVNANVNANASESHLLESEDESAAAAATSATYDFLLQRLYQVNRFTAVKLGIENMKQLNAAFGDPASRYEVVHVAGTNGKGSVSFKIAKALERSGYKTGLFVSPHVACFRERIQVNGTLISEEEVCETLSEIFNISAQLRIPATFFEITTMLAFQYFAKQNVDCVVLETGLGGRLDATNIVTPSLSVITSIGMDHMRILGNTIPDIAREKAGIMKPNIPVVIGPHAPLDIMRGHADALNASLVQVPLESGFADDFNAENTAIAREAVVQLNRLSHKVGNSELSVDLESRRVASALESRPPCRFQVFHIVRPNSTERKVTIVLDVAHNPPAIAKLGDLLRKRFPDKKYRFVCGFSADKDMKRVVSTITTACKHNASPQELDDDALLQTRIHLVKANNPRSASLDEINNAIAGVANQDTNDAEDSSTKEQWSRPFDSIASIEDGVNAAIAAARASPDDEVVVVCGSVFLMAEARQALGFKEPIDSPTLNAVAGAHLSTPESRLAVAKTGSTAAAKASSS